MKLPKFKVGDAVDVTSSPYSSVAAGQCGVITRVYGLAWGQGVDRLYDVKLRKESRPFREHELKR